jgi:hypothetical protein
MYLLRTGLFSLTLLPALIVSVGADRCPTPGRYKCGSVIPNAAEGTGVEILICDQNRLTRRMNVCGGPTPCCGQSGGEWSETPAVCLARGVNIPRPSLCGPPG